MGGAKDDMLRMEGVYAQARRVAVTAGALSTCPIHDDVFIDQMDSASLEDAYRIGAAKVRDGKINSDHKEFMAAIKMVVEESAMDCGYCAKNDD